MSETVSTAAREAEVKRHRKENFKATLRVFFGRGILSKVCFVILVAFILVAVIGPFLLSDPYSQSVLQKLSDPSQEHFLGTDQLGRDLLTRVVWGARISMVTGLLSAFWAALIGTALGLVAGYFQGIVGNIIMRITDALLSIPPLILTMVLSAVCGGSILSISLIIAVSSVPGYVRMIYSQVLSLRESDYVTASGLIGQNSFMILVKHLLPNCFATLIVMFTMSVGANVMIEAGLSYLGVGITAPTLERNAGCAWSPDCYDLPGTHDKLGPCVYSGQSALRSHPQAPQMHEKRSLANWCAGPGGRRHPGP